ncbi:TlpA disulfide reductase family protein [Aliiruegeria sabulilitoris]|uniref:TlpA disulfide reductase family protein n=1 Tax=Aliiruegeria sabulilitoris TaxID=1510458 RepID=UPI000834544A|nr:TlpA disulfide reductase family protein [Aliiruegeria sabulilitoris]NDR57785.1 TlpA family protein disulfide reductase [Pseudoruegeria sp. M32A2M]
MKNLLAAMVYTGLALLANPALADMSAVAALREGDMKKLVLHEDARPLPDVPIVDLTDAPVSLADHQGKWLVMNFWATWCAPCRKEMPTLANLQTAMEGKPVDVVTVATGRNHVPAIRKFFDEIDVDNLPLYRDPQQQLARQMGVMGLPVTVIVSPEGAEIGRLIGDAHWDSDSALAILNMLAGESP